MSTKKIKKTELNQPRASPDESEECIKQALIQKALGFETNETIEEYNCDEDGIALKLVKKKITKKQFPPDLEAVQKLIDLKDIKTINLDEKSDFELEEEKQRLLILLAQKGEINEN